MLQAQHFRELGADLLRRVTEVLHALGLTFWLSSGTLLGWYVKAEKDNTEKKPAGNVCRPRGSNDCKWQRFCPFDLILIVR